MRLSSPGKRARVRSSWKRPSCLMAVVLPVAAAPEMIRPRRAPISRWLSSVNNRPWLVIASMEEVVTTTSSEWWATRASL